MMDDTLFDSLNAAYAQAMYEQFARNPDAVPNEWRRLFAGRPLWVGLSCQIPGAGDWLTDDFAIRADGAMSILSGDDAGPTTASTPS